MRSRISSISSLSTLEGNNIGLEGAAALRDVLNADTELMWRDDHCQESECAVRGGVERWPYALIERHLGSQSPKVADFW